ncbi:PorV/PorQ family protein [bacterium SCSIO 12741]|nr:PorV/PorQ family protein [bacterium SCSIO 12741]
MRNRFLTLLIALNLIGLFVSQASIAGNKDRIGQNGANQLTVNPWARSNGLAFANSTSMIGLESLSTNISGLAFTKKTEILYSYTNFMGGASNINSFGLSQKVGETGVIGLSVMNMSFGEVEITTEDKPEGGIGVYSPQFLNFNLAYARAFSNSIYAGIAVKVVSESIADVKTQGIALDVGIRYVTGKDDKLKFGIALRNIGPKMRYNGDGLAEKTQFDGKEFTLSQRSEAFEMPAELNIGVSYDYYIGQSTDTTGKTGKTDHRLTGAGTFVSKSFGKDEIRAGLEYGWKEMVFLRAGLLYEQGIFSSDERTTIYTGPSFGAGFEYPLGKSKSTIGIDYSYVLTNPFGGNHLVGLRLNL